MKKIAVMGAGALGGYFGGRLAQAGHEVTFIARGAHLEAIKSDGLRIISPKGDIHLANALATENPAEIGRVDVVLFMVKNGDVEDAADAIKPILEPDTLVVTCQNGVTAWERLASSIGAHHVVPGVARIPGHISQPGTVVHTAQLDMLQFGESDGTTSKRCEMLRQLLDDAGTTPVIMDQILHELWSKFCGQSTMASMTTLSGLDIGPLRENPVSAKLFQDAIAEAYRVGVAAIPDLPDSVLKNNWDFFQKLPPSTHASMLDDLRQGKPLENEYLSGDVVRLGEKSGIETPIHSTFYGTLKPISDQLAKN